MNKSFLILSSLVGLGLTASAQNKNVVSAINYLNYYQQDKSCDNLSNAKSYIDQASNHADTKESAKMWYNRGMIYQFIGESKDPKCTALAPNAFSEAVTSYMNSMKFDVKKNYEQDIKQRMRSATANLTNKGITEFQNGNFAQALTMFESSIDINKAVFGETDAVSIYNAALAAERSKNYPKARDMYQRMIDLKGKDKDGAKYYSYLANVYTNENDTANYAKTIMAGRAAFPDDLGLILSETNIYLSQPGKEKEAINNLNAAIAKDPSNYNLHFALGSTYDKLNDFENAEKNYKKSLELKADYFDGLYNIGALYYNKAVKINEAANSIKDNAKYQKEITRADEYFKYALPYLEKAHEVNPKDRNTLLSLKALYARLEMNDKYKKIEEELKN